MFAFYSPIPAVAPLVKTPRIGLISDIIGGRRMHVYEDWKFWSVIVSAIAIVLSQLPPVHVLLRRAKLDVEAYSRVHLAHKVGNPNVQLQLILSNIGGRDLKIKNITLMLKKDGGDWFSLPAQNYLQDPSDKQTVLFSRFTLKPDQEWLHIVNFFNFFNRDDEKQYRSSETNLRNDIFRKKQFQPDVIVEADSQNVAPLMEMLDRLFPWKPGEYELWVVVNVQPSKATITKRYRMTLFESDTEELRSSAEGYKHGFGIFIDDLQHPGLLVPLREI